MLNSPPLDEASGATILVADDDDDFRGFVVATLRFDGYRVIEARDGGEMLDLLAEILGDPSARPDLIVTDLRMPNLSGFGLLQELKRVQVRLPVLMMTGFHLESVQVLAQRLGAVAVLKKPFDVTALRSAVTSALRPRA